MTSRCANCGRIRDLRMGHCFDCVESESIIADGTDMSDELIAVSSLDKLNEVTKRLQ